MVLLARTLTRSEFGLFALLYAGLLYAQGLQNALITQPHNVIGATRAGAAYNPYTRTTATTQLALSVLLVIVGSLGWLAAHVSGGRRPRFSPPSCLRSRSGRFRSSPGACCTPRGDYG